jgi:hypothetical protein
LGKVAALRMRAAYGLENLLEELTDTTRHFASTFYRADTDVLARAEGAFSNIARRARGMERYKAADAFRGAFRETASALRRAFANIACAAADIVACSGRGLELVFALVFGLALAPG